MHSAALAVNQIDSSKFIEYSYLLMENQQHFFDVNCWHKSIHEIYSDLIKLASTIGVDSVKMGDLLNLDTNVADKNAGHKITPMLKQHIKACFINIDCET